MKHVVDNFENYSTKHVRAFLCFNGFESKIINYLATKIIKNKKFIFFVILDAIWVAIRDVVIIKCVDYNINFRDYINIKLSRLCYKNMFKYNVRNMY
jgi:hypothetical protein